MLCRVSCGVMVYRRCDGVSCGVVVCRVMVCRVVSCVVWCDGVS